MNSLSLFRHSSKVWGGGIMCRMWVQNACLSPCPKKLVFTSTSPNSCRLGRAVWKGGYLCIPLNMLRLLPTVWVPGCRRASSVFSQTHEKHLPSDNPTQYVNVQVKPLVMLGTRVSFPRHITATWTLPHYQYAFVFWREQKCGFNFQLFSNCLGML